MPLIKSQYEEILLSCGYDYNLHETERAFEYKQKTSSEIVYIHDKARTRLVIHPNNKSLHSALNGIAGITSMSRPDGLLHGSNFRAFPKRKNRGELIHYGYGYEADSKRALRDLLDKLNG